MTGASGGPFRLRILHPTGTGAYIGAGTSAPASPGISPTTEVPTSLPIQVGDLIGFDPTNGGDRMGLVMSLPDSFVIHWTPRLADGSSRSPSAPPFAAEWAYAALVRYCRVPRMKGMKLKRAKRILRGRDCAIGKIKVVKVRGGGPPRVTRQSRKAGSAVSDTQRIHLKLKPAT
jgi:hypothetical protein